MKCEALTCGLIFLKIWELFRNLFKPYFSFDAIQEISGVQCITFWNFLEQKSGCFYDFALLPRPFLHALMCFNNEYPILVLFIPFCLSPRGYWQWQLNVNEFATFAEFAWKCKLVCCFVFPIQFNTLIEGSYSFLS